MPALENREQLTLSKQFRAEALELDDSPSGSPTWDTTRRRFRDHVRSDDPRRFLQWNEIRSTMFVSDSTCAQPELHALMRSDEWQRRWSDVLVEDASGCPDIAKCHPASSENLIHHAYHVLAAEDHLGPIADFGSIVEFGGGYGSFVRLLRRLGFTDHYHINDFPEFAALQRYYLGSVAVARRTSAIRKNVTWGSSIADLPEKTPRRLFTALWSLSETSLSTRDPWREVIASSDGVLIAFQGEFEGIDNKAWFGEMQQRVALHWACWEHPYLPGNFYLVGRRVQPRPAEPTASDEVAVPA